MMCTKHIVDNIVIIIIILRDDVIHDMLHHITDATRTAYGLSSFINGLFQCWQVLKLAFDILHPKQIATPTGLRDTLINKH